MKALVYDGPGRRSWTDHAEPVLTAPTDAIVRIDAVTICGTDLHILCRRPTRSASATAASNPVTPW
ncbi:hypothetical protein ACIA5G_30925 [Amycolatopsis sp. NPDC051758]|uniref:hypothetical protein n=1 Tax=Amycolatopsis sp. NPDC051758 TaxID=3363935 RepID=UPI0037B09519